MAWRSLLVGLVAAQGVDGGMLFFWHPTNSFVPWNDLVIMLLLP